LLHWNGNTRLQLLSSSGEDTRSLNVKKNYENQSPELQTERFLLIKVDDNEHEIKDLLIQHGITFEDFIVQSIPDS